MKKLIYKIYNVVPLIQPVYRTFRTIIARYLLRKTVKGMLANHQPIRIVLGAKKKFPTGWIPTEIYTLNILKQKDWERYFPIDAIDVLLAEHVWEHLTEEEGVLAAKLCFMYLKAGGYLRAAVPDGLFPDPQYIEFVRPGGVGPSARDHKTLYNYNTFRGIFEQSGFEVNLLEYFDEKGEFHSKDWDPDGGLIVRSLRFYNGHSFGSYKYRSLILDARKPKNNSNM